ncbi:AAA family ATPase [Kitasatospora sp. NPDC096147]|uniref:AAA family ATPase n=1 Tax=Kitasatospora sp. NPDC096147 TaxID=3364093 RepID=UPI0037F6343C
MITQIRIDGFKSFVGFELDVHPVTVLLGVNGAGKSNLFDALRLVAGTLRQGLGETLAGDRRLAARDLFHRGGQGPLRDELTITVGALLETPVGPVPARARLVLDRGSGHRQPGLDRDSRIWVSNLERTDWMDRLGLTTEQRRSVADARTAFLATGESAEVPMDPRHERSRASELHHLFALDAVSWAPYALEPGALRELGRPEDDGALRPNGRNLAVVLDRIRAEAPERFTRLVADLAAIVPGVRDIRTEVIRTRGEFDFEVEFQHTGWVSPASLSDGTLRALALLATSWDVGGGGTLLVEEVENGMHLAQVADLVRRLGQDAGLTTGEPLRRTRQLIVTTHSPALLGALRHDLSGSLVFLEQANLVDPERSAVSRVTRARPLRPRGTSAEPGDTVSPQAVARLLRSLGQEVR